MLCVRSSGLTIASYRKEQFDSQLKIVWAGQYKNETFRTALDTVSDSMVLNLRYVSPL